MTGRMNKPVALLASLGALALLGGAGSATTFLSGEEPTTIETPVITAAPSSVTLACPPGIIDPFASTPATTTTGHIWSTLAPTNGDELARSITTSGAPNEELSVPTGVVITGQGGGELLGLSATGCSLPSGDQWILVGSTYAGNDVVLALANPSATPATISVTAYGPIGLLDDAPHTLTVPAGKTITVVPSGWYPDEERIALHIESDSAGVSAWAQTSRLDGEIPAGATWSASTKPATQAVFAGLGGETASILRIGVPGEDPASIQVTLIGEDGSKVVEGTELEIDAQTVLDIPLTGIASTASGIMVTSNAPVVSALEQSWDGGKWAQTDQTWTILSNIATANAISKADVPGLTTLSDLVTKELSATPLRATSLESSSGVSDVIAQMVLVNPLTDASSDATVSVAGQEVQVPAGTTTVVDLPRDNGKVTSDQPIYASIVVSATTPNGVVHATWNVGTGGLVTQQARVHVGP